MKFVRYCNEFSLNLEDHVVEYFGDSSVHGFIIDKCDIAISVGGFVGVYCCFRKDSADSELTSEFAVQFSRNAVDFIKDTVGIAEHRVIDKRQIESYLHLYPTTEKFSKDYNTDTVDSFHLHHIRQPRGNKRETPSTLRDAIETEIDNIPFDVVDRVTISKTHEFIKEFWQNRILVCDKAWDIFHKNISRSIIFNKPGETHQQVFGFQRFCAIRIDDAVVLTRAASNQDKVVIIPLNAKFFLEVVLWKNVNIRIDEFASRIIKLIGFSHRRIKVHTCDHVNSRLAKSASHTSPTTEEVDRSKSSFDQIRHIPK